MPLKTGDKVLLAAAGGAAGAAIHRQLAGWQGRARDAGRGEPRLAHGHDAGALVALFGLLLPEGHAKYLLAGGGAGMAVHDAYTHWTQGRPVRPLDLRGEEDVVLRWSKWVHIDPDLPLEEKEARILPLVPHTVVEQRANPLQQNALRIFRWELGLPEDRLTIGDCKKVQAWFLREGRYTASEGKFHGHDRFRTLAKILRQRRRYGRSEFDCDDFSVCFGQLVDSYGIAPRWCLVSQRPVPPGAGVNPLHHILPLATSDGRYWLVEGIRRAPIIPLDAINMMFSGLKRVVILEPDGSYWEYDGWRRRG